MNEIQKINLTIVQYLCVCVCVRTTENTDQNTSKCYKMLYYKIVNDA